MDLGGGVVDEINNLEQNYLPVNDLLAVQTDVFPLSAALGFVFTEANSTLPTPKNYVSVLTAPWYLITSEDVFDKVDYQELYEANEAIVKMLENYYEQL